MPDQAKRCPTCGQEKPLEEFPPNRAKRDGRQDHCRPCYRAYQTKWRALHRAEYIAYLNRYYQGHRDELAVKNHAYRQANWDAILKRTSARNREYRQANPERTTLLWRTYSIVRQATRSGRLVKPSSCEECRATDRRLTAAHHDYTQPLTVRWLCYQCHARWDSTDPKLGGWSTSSRSAVRSQE